MIETSARLLRLLSLFQGRRYWSGTDLASRLEITARTLRRDIGKLRTLGYPIRSTTGLEGGYQMGAGSQMPPLLLDDDEAIAVALGLRAAATGTLEGVEEASLRALAKIEQLLPQRLARRVTALQSMVVTSTASGPSVNARVLSTIAAACRDCESLSFRYSGHGGKPSLREVDPHRLVHTRGRWYLVAWDHARRDWRTFRADRIQPKVATGPRFPPRDPPDKDLAAYVARGAWVAPPCKARVKLLVSAESAIPHIHPCAGMIEPIDDTSCYFISGAASYESLAMHLSLLGFDFEVTGPPEFVEQVRSQGKRYLRALPTP